MRNKLFLSDAFLNVLAAYQQCIVGFSGGLDSSVLLHLLSQQLPERQRLKALHVHHGLNDKAGEWQAHCQRFCQNLGVDFMAEWVDFDRTANVEENARKARYAAFSKVLGSQDALLLAHHQDDQAETLLLQLFRGAGVDGLSAMSACSRFAGADLLRPLLDFSREALEAYAREHQLDWIEDPSNESPVYRRNWIRHHLIPLLETQWPQVKTNIARSASHCQQARNNLDDLAAIDAASAVRKEKPLSLSPFYHLDEARQMNLLRLWLKKQDIRLPSAQTQIRILQELIHAKTDAQAEVCWDSVKLRRFQEDLYLLPLQWPKLPAHSDWSHFPSPLALGDDRLLAEEALEGFSLNGGEKIEVAFRQGGEHFYYHGQRKALKKLLQQWQIPPWMRDRLPLIYVNGELAAVGEHAISDNFYTRSGACWTIRLVSSGAIHEKSKKKGNA